ncbi:hypothetical protein SAMN05660477_00098 [Soonwooa buanensis]|uniref:Uncharacterized protein n=1 Tax=Soonwooa buanensis TaxID=619805 RepID=A0A1T5CIZ3_9FLAO|nr:hypothetical protein [Soonwooa buanensis]SKB59442.1 hypothetical protein SAMN05660477_00098 [Soonwooa buanensis]
MKNIIRIIVVFASVMFSAQHLELGKDKINLENFKMPFDVNSFYKKQLELNKKTTELLEQDKMDTPAYDKLLKQYKFVEGIKTIDVSDTKKLLLYEMKSINTKDTLAFFGNVKFQKLEMISNQKNEFQSLRAVSFSYKDNKKNYEHLKNILVKKFGNPQKIDSDNFAEKEYFLWKTKDFVYILSLKIETEKDVPKYYYSDLYIINGENFEDLKMSFNKIYNYWNL